MYLFFILFLNVKCITIYHNNIPYGNITCDVPCVNIRTMNANVLIDDHIGIYKHSHKRKVIISQESGVNYPILRNAKLYGYELVLTSHPDSDIQNYYIGYNTKWLENNTFSQIKPWKSRIKKVVALISNCDDKNKRISKIKRLKKLGVHIDGFGDCYDKHIKNDSWISGRLELFSDYVIGFAIENSRELGYVTEKYFLTLASGAVPVYSGAYDIYKYAPTINPYMINLDTMNLSDAAILIKQILVNETLWLEYQSFRGTEIPSFYKHMLEITKNKMECHVCRYYKNLC